MKKIIIAVSVIALLVACSQSQKPGQEAENGAVVQTGVEIIDARIRAPLNGADVTAAYVTIKNHDSAAIEIIGGSSDIAQKLELHTHEKGADGMMQMRQVEKFVVAPSDKLLLEPGGNHIMLFTPKAGLKEGDIGHITLTTKSGNSLEFNAVVVTNPKVSTSGGHEGMGHEMGESEKTESGLKSGDVDKKNSHEGH